MIANNRLNIAGIVAATSLFSIFLWLPIVWSRVHFGAKLWKSIWGYAPQQYYAVALLPVALFWTFVALNQLVTRFYANILPHTRAYVILSNWTILIIVAFLLGSIFSILIYNFAGLSFDALEPRYAQHVLNVITNIDGRFRGPNQDEYIDGKSTGTNREEYLRKQKSSMDDWKLLSGEDFIDLSAFAGRLAAHSDTLSGYFHSNLSRATQLLLTNYQIASNGDAKLRTALTEEFSKLLSQTSIYEPELFEGVSLSEPTRQGLAVHSPGPIDPRLNRMLFEDAFPDLIARNFIFSAVPSIRDYAVRSTAIERWVTNLPPGQFMNVVLNPVLQRKLNLLNQTTQTLSVLQTLSICFQVALSAFVLVFVMVVSREVDPATSKDLQPAIWAMHVAIFCYALYPVIYHHYAQELNQYAYRGWASQLHVLVGLLLLVSLFLISPIAGSVTNPLVPTDLAKIFIALIAAGVYWVDGFKPQFLRQLIGVEYSTVFEISFALVLWLVSALFTWVLYS